ncbi:hypothetical protein EYF80_025229 [Liparis tanakae]|uniref:Uncharacterized protein n=1 Tax=Liparis tanakae TaxID=230148 RepID=A0A4Z2HIC4_9TELE|nr:hypothetical protein EYF80_025229 [Liparis tanakae]
MNDEYEDVNKQRQEEEALVCDIDPCAAFRCSRHDAAHALESAEELPVVVLCKMISRLGVVTLHSTGPSAKKALMAATPAHQPDRSIMSEPSAARILLPNAVGQCAAFQEDERDLRGGETEPGRVHGAPWFVLPEDDRSNSTRVFS